MRRPQGGTEADRLAARWPLPSADSLRDELVAAYAAPERGYHDVRHLADVLDRLDELRAAGEPFDPLVVALAAWFHDAVYDAQPGAEQRSAAWAGRALADEGLPAAPVEVVVRLVERTARHDPGPGDVDAAALCDADLAVLASDRHRYAEYAAGVRREYAHLPDPVFRAGRAAVLRDLLARAHLFHTGHGRARWEPAARRNVAAELNRLE